MLDFCSPSKEGERAPDTKVTWEDERANSRLARSDRQSNGLMDFLLKNYCEPPESVASEPAEDPLHSHDLSSTAPQEPPSYSSMFSASGNDRSAKGVTFKPQQRSPSDVERYSWDEAAVQLKEQRRQHFQEDESGNLVPKTPKRSHVSKNSQALQFEKLTKEVCTDQTEQARARRVAKVRAEQKTQESRAMRHSGDYRVRHVKSSTTPAAKGYKTVVEGKEMSPFHSLMENLRHGLADPGRQ